VLLGSGATLDLPAQQLKVPQRLRQNLHQLLYCLDRTAGSPFAAPANVVLRHFRHQCGKAVASNAAVRAATQWEAPPCCSAAALHFAYLLETQGSLTFEAK
jgi:hypothetical protein